MLALQNQKTSYYENKKDILHSYISCTSLIIFQRLQGSEVNKCSTRLSRSGHSGSTGSLREERYHSFCDRVPIWDHSTQHCPTRSSLQEKLTMRLEKELFYKLRIDIKCTDKKFLTTKFLITNSPITNFLIVKFSNVIKFLI